MKRWLIGGALTTLVLVGGGLAWWGHDEPLSAQAQAWLEQAAVDGRQSQAYLLLTGLDAVAGQAPEALGAKRLQAYRSWRSSHSPMDEGYKEPEVATLALPQGPLFCAPEKQDCLASLLNGAAAWVESDEQRLLRERYWQFLQLDDYRNLQEASITAPMPPFQYLTAGQQLSILQSLKTAMTGEGAQVQALLDEELHLLRGQLRRADTLIEKMILARLVERNMRLQAVLYRQGLMPAPTRVAAFDEAERSLLRPMQHEFQGAALMYRSLGQSKKTATESVLMWLGLRPQMSINVSLGFYQPFAELSLLPPAEFAREVKSLPAAQWQKNWRNPVGNILLGVATPDFREYAARVHDLEALRRLLQGVAQLPPGTPSAEQLRAFDNPYYPGQPAQLDAQGQLCFAGPLSARYGARCLSL